MTCFWDAIINKLEKSDLILLGLQNKPNPKILCSCLVKKKELISDKILWQNKPISLQERKEHLLAIKDNPCLVNRGHLTSSCDSFLLLICHICHINITHHGILGIYNYKYPNAKRNIILYSNSYHMWS